MKDSFGLVTKGVSMSTYLYGLITRRRDATPVGDGPIEGMQDDVSAQEPVSHWQDALAALVPAEVLVLHGVAMSFGTTTKGEGQDSVTTITYPDQMIAVYAAMLVLALGLYFLAAKSIATWEGWLRGLCAAGAFVAWTMIQPSTAFDAFGFQLTTFARIMIAIFAAILLTVLVNWLATRADKSTPT